MRPRYTAALIQAELVAELPVHISANIVRELSKAYAQASQNGAAKESEYPNPASGAPLDPRPVLNLHIEYEQLDTAVRALYFGSPGAPSPVLEPVYTLNENGFGVASF